MDSGTPAVGVLPSRTEAGADAEAGASDADGVAEPAEEVVVEASGDAAVDAVEEVSEERSGEAASDGAVDEVGSPADVLEPPGSCEDRKSTRLNSSHW